MKINQKGFGLIEGLLILLVLAVMGFGGYYVWHSQKKTTPAPSATASTKSSTSPSPTEKTLVTYLTIKEWGIKLPLSASIADAYYVVSTSSQDSNGKPNTIWLGIKSLDANGCSANNGNNGRSPILGAIVKALPTDTNPVSGELLTKQFPNGATVGNYYYGYTAYSGLKVGSTCGSLSTLTTIDTGFKSASDNIVAE